MSTENKKDYYKWIKIIGLLSSLPFILASGPMGGYFIGDYITRRFNLGIYVTFIFIVVGFIGSLIETIKVIRMLIKIDRKDSRI